MLSGKFRQAIASRERILRIIWFALLGAIVFYVGLAFTIGGRGEALVAAENLRLLNLIFPVVSVGIVAAALLWHRIALSETSLVRRMDAVGTGDPAVAGVGLEVEERKLLALAPRYATVMIVTWALIESLCLLGLVLALLLRGPLLILPYAGVSVVLMILTRPDLAGALERAARLAR